MKKLFILSIFLVALGLIFNPFSPPTSEAQSQNPLAMNLQPPNTKGVVDIFSVATPAAGAGSNPVGAAGTILTINAPGAGYRNYYTTMNCANTQSTGTVIQIKEGTSVLGSVACPPTFGAGGFVLFNPPVRGTVNTAQQIAITAIQTSHVTVTGFIAQ